LLQDARDSLRIGRGSQDKLPVTACANDALASDALAATVLAGYPGAVLVCELEGTVGAVHGAAHAALLGVVSCGQALHLALGFNDEAAEAAALQLWLAGLMGADVAGWDLYYQDPPRHAHAGAALELDYMPIFAAGLVERIVVFVRAARAAAAAGTGKTEPVDEAVTATPEQLESFRSDARRLLAEAHAAIARLEGDLQARQALNRLFRAVHTLKGSAHGLGLTEIKDVAHAAEDELDEVRAMPGEVPVYAVLRAAAQIETMRTMVEALRVGPSVTHAHVQAPEKQDPFAPLRWSISACRSAARGDRTRILDALRDAQLVGEVGGQGRVA